MPTQRETRIQSRRYARNQARGRIVASVKRLTEHTMALYSAPTPEDQSGTEDNIVEEVSKLLLNVTRHRAERRAIYLEEGAQT